MFYFCRYIYIEYPFWYGIRVTTNRLVIYNCVCGVVSHVIGLIPLMMSEVMETQHCSEYDLLLGVEYNISYALIVLLLFIAIGIYYCCRQN